MGTSAAPAEHRDQSSNHWRDRMLDSQIIGIQELIVSSYGQHLNPDQLRLWLHHIGELEARNKKIPA